MKARGALRLIAVAVSVAVVALLTRAGAPRRTGSRRRPARAHEDALRPAEEASARWFARSATPRRVRLSGRLVAPRLEQSWVHAESPAFPPSGLLEQTRGELERAVGGPVVDPDDRDPDGHEVETWLGRPGASWAIPYGATLPDEEGRFELDLEPGLHVLVAGALGCRTRVETLQVTADLDVEWALDWTPPAVVTVRCVDESGRPARGRRLYLVLHGRFAVPIVDPSSSPPPLDPPQPWLLAPPGALHGDDAYGQPTLGRFLPLDDDGAARVVLPAGQWMLTRAVLFQETVVRAHEHAPEVWGPFSTANTTSNPSRNAP